MKYSKSNPPLVCMQTQSTCYNGTSRMTVRGLLVHSTGANNPNLKRYVQPSDDAKDKAEMLKMLGTNTNRNDWNHIQQQAGLNYWIGKLADGSVATVQTMPWDYRPWGCGSGSKGSCNNGWIQGEICEDGLSDRSYCLKTYEENAELAAYLFTLFNLDPLGTVAQNGVKVPTILCHQDSYKLGLGSNHGDVMHWWPKHGLTMDGFRHDVLDIMNASGWSIATSPSAPSPSSGVPYTVIVTAPALNIRREGKDGAVIVGCIYDNGACTIVEESKDGKWGRLKSGAGWIALAFTRKA